MCRGSVFCSVCKAGNFPSASLDYCFLSGYNLRVGVEQENAAEELGYLAFEDLFVLEHLDALGDMILAEGEGVHFLRQVLAMISWVV